MPATTCGVTAADSTPGDERAALCVLHIDFQSCDHQHSIAYYRGASSVALPMIVVRLQALAHICCKSLSVVAQLEPRGDEKGMVTTVVPNNKRFEPCHYAPRACRKRETI